MAVSAKARAWRALATLVPDDVPDGIDLEALQDGLMLLLREIGRWKGGGRYGVVV